MNSFLKRLWQSPTATTWASFGARALNLVVVLPWVLRQFTAAEVALWQSISTLISLQLLVDLGFGSTFSRLIAYAMGGAMDLGNPISGGRHPSPNWDLLEQIASTARLVFIRLAWISGTMTLLGGTAALLLRVEALSAESIHHLTKPPQTQPLEAWCAWGIVLITTIITFRGNSYSAILQGSNNIALLRRWEALFACASIVSSILALVSHKGILALALANQSWLALSAWRNRQLCIHLFRNKFKRFPPPKLHRNVFQVAWPAAWRSGLGTFMWLGLIQISGLVYAQSRDSAAVASYLLGTRLVQTLSQISQAPFYSKLPMLAQLWSEGELAKQTTLAQRGMTIAYWSFTIPFMGLGLLGPSLFNQLGSSTPFPPPLVWAVLGLSMLLERYGAMHLQLYSVTNHIVWHIANGVSGLLFLTVSAITFPRIGMLALPLGMLSAMLGFYAWYSAWLSHRQFSLPWPTFDLKSIGIPFFMLSAYLIYAY